MIASARAFISLNLSVFPLVLGVLIRQSNIPSFYRVKIQHIYIKDYVYGEIQKTYIYHIYHSEPCKLEASKNKTVFQKIAADVIIMNNPQSPLYRLMMEDFRATREVCASGFNYLQLFLQIRSSCYSGTFETDLNQITGKQI